MHTDRKLAIYTAFQGNDWLALFTSPKLYKRNFTQLLKQHGRRVRNYLAVFYGNGQNTLMDQVVWFYARNNEVICGNNNFPVASCMRIV